jgi:hypothetical protein
MTTGLPASKRKGGVIQGAPVPMWTDVMRLIPRELSLTTIPSHFSSTFFILRWVSGKKVYEALLRRGAVLLLGATCSRRPNPSTPAWRRNRNESSLSDRSIAICWIFLLTAESAICKNAKKTQRKKEKKKRNGGVSGVDFTTSPPACGREIPRGVTEIAGNKPCTREPHLRRS